MERDEREVDFHKWCLKRIYQKELEETDPCVDCLAQPINENTDRPLFFKEA